MSSKCPMTVGDALRVLIEEADKNGFQDFQNRRLITKNSSGKWCDVEHIYFADLPNSFDKEIAQKFENCTEIFVVAGTPIPELNKEDDE